MNIQDWFPFRLTGWISLQSQGLSSLLQYHSSKALILQCSAFFTVQLSHPYITTGKTITLTRRTFVYKVMSLLFNMLSRVVIAFLPRSKCLHFMVAVTICSDFGAQENKLYHCFPTYLPWSDRTGCHSIWNRLVPRWERSTPRLEFMRHNKRSHHEIPVNRN